MSRFGILYAVKTDRVDAVKLQFMSSLELGAEDIVAIPTNYSGITLINFDDSFVASSKSVRNIEALLIDEVAAAELRQPSMASDALSFKSLDGVDEREQYEHLSQLLYIQKQRETKDEIFRS